MSLTASKYASGFSPQNIPGLVIWLDAADSNAVTQSSGVVSAWRDKSPNPINVTQDTLAARPTYESNVQNGLPALRFTTSQMMQSTSNLTLPPEQSWFVSFRPLATPHMIFVEHGPNVNTTAGSYFYGSNNALIQIRRSGVRTIFDAAGVGATIFPVGSWYIASVVNSNLTTSPTTDIFWTLNGARRNVTTDSNLLTGNATNLLYINPTSRVPASNYTGEILIYDRALPAGEVRLIERYLAYKWGVTLPTAHPFSWTPATLRAFNPLDISGCSLWLDAADQPTLTFSTGCNISQWNDKSGNGYNATAFNSPTYSTFNGNLNGITLNGVNTYFYYSNATAMNTTSNLSAFVVGQAIFPSMGSAWARLLSFGNPDQAGISNGIAFLRYSNVNQLTYERNVTPPAPALTFGSTVSFVGSVVFNANGVAHRINGASNSFTSGSTGAFNYSLYNIGRHSGGAFQWAGMICEAITYNASLDSNQVQQVELYLAEKWNLRSSLSTSNRLRLYNSLSPVFNPTLLSNCTLWLDALDNNALVLSGSSVTTWRDKSGGGFNGSVIGTVTNTGNINGRTALNWATADSSFVGNSSNSGTTVTVFSVFNMATSAANFARVVGLGLNGQFDFNSTAYCIPILRINATTAVSSYRNNVQLSTVANGLNQNILACALFDGTNNTLFTNGTSNTSVGSSGSFGYTNYGIGFNLAGNADPQGYFVGRIGEVLIYNAAMTRDQRQLVEGYLAWKWGLVGNLPSTHPYKKTPV
jgi:hypothetical protein